MLAGARSLYASAQWGRMQPPEVRRALGFPESAMPAATTLHYAFKWLDTTGFEVALHQQSDEMAASQCLPAYAAAMLAKLASPRSSARGRLVPCWASCNGTPPHAASDGHCL